MRQSVSDGSRDALPSISRYVCKSTARIKRLRAGQERVLRALAGEPPQGVSRVDWIAQRLNGA